MLASTPTQTRRTGQRDDVTIRGPIGRDGPMAAAPLLHTPDEIEVRSGPTAAGPAALTIVALIAIVAGIALFRGGLLERPVGLDGGAETATPAELTATAADVLEQATAPGGGGYTFSIVQTAAIVA